MCFRSSCIVGHIGTPRRIYKNFDDALCVTNEMLNFVYSYCQNERIINSKTEAGGKFLFHRSDGHTATDSMARAYLRIDENVHCTRSLVARRALLIYISFHSLLLALLLPWLLFLVPSLPIPLCPDARVCADAMPLCCLYKCSVSWQSPLCWLKWYFLSFSFFHIFLLLSVHLNSVFLRSFFPSWYFLFLKNGERTNSVWSGETKSEEKKRCIEQIASVIE